MKFRLLTLIILLVLTASLFGPFGGVTVAQAQTCTDPATGGVIDCPPSGGDSGSGDDDNSGGGSQPGGGNPNPPTNITATPSPTPSPEPTNTPLPISDKPTEDPTKNAPVFEVTPTPTQGPVIAAPSGSGDTQGENDWDDICTFDLCLGLTVACYWDGGTPEIVADGSGNTGVHCNIPDGTDSGASSPWGPWVIVVVFAILVGLLIPAVQKIRDSAARKSQHIKVVIETMNSENAKNDDASEGSDYFLEIDKNKK